MIGKAKYPSSDEKTAEIFPAALISHAVNRHRRRIQ